MQQFMNTLYVTTPGAYVKREGESIEIHIDGEKKMEIPLIHLNGLVCFGNVLVSPGVIHRFGEENRSIVWHDQSGRFQGRLVGPTNGNVLLREAQHQFINDPARRFAIARQLVAGKIRNSRQVILRSAREEENQETKESLSTCARKLAHALDRIAPDRLGVPQSLDFLRGIEGNAARDYFSIFGLLIKADEGDFVFEKRTRRPPRDRVNTLLSFLYAILLNDCVSAADGIGLDPQFGFLHDIRPGRPALGLDLMEELRSILADRLVLTLINRKQVTGKDFVERPGGAVHLTKEGRKTVIRAYQERKQTKIHHSVLNVKTAYGLIPHTQARLLARHLRGDLEEYVPFYSR